MRSSLVVGSLLLLPLAAAEAAPTDPESLTWEIEGVLAVGGGGLTEEDVDYLRARGFTAIANFRAEHEDPESAIRAHGMDFLYLPTPDASDINVSMLETYVRWQEARVAAGDVSYIHCTNGMHRAAAYAAAFLMKTNGWSADEAFQYVKERRGGTVMRAPQALLAYESKLAQKPGLAVVLVSPLNHAEAGSNVTAKALVFGNGKPLPGANVRVWSEETRISLAGTTDAEGAFVFQYATPTTGFMDHLYARASAAGFGDGADAVEIFFNEPARARSAPVVAVWARAIDGTTVWVDVARNARSTPARILVSSDAGEAAYDLSSHGDATLVLPTLASRVIVRVFQWGAPITVVESKVEPADSSPPPDPDPFPQDAAPPDPGELPQEFYPERTEFTKPSPESTPPVEFPAGDGHPLFLLVLAVLGALMGARRAARLAETPPPAPPKRPYK